MNNKKFYRYADYSVDSCFYSLSDLIIETHITSNGAYSTNLQRPVYPLGTVTLYLQSYLPVFTSNETLAEISFAS